MAESTEMKVARENLQKASDELGATLKKYQKQRPTIALCMILKNERENLPKLLESVRGCFDELHFIDTGSTDGTLEYLKALHASPEFPSISWHHFDWVDDFAAARNFAFSKASADYVMWLDGDDVLGNPAAFKLWRDTAMELADFWLAPYHYAFHEGRPTCSFARERVVKRSKGFRWKYFIHEGIDIKSGFGEVKANQIGTWCVNHMRTEEDLKKDRSRNIRIFEKHAATDGKNFPPRMHYYWGKELFEAGQMIEAFNKLGEASAMDLELHDRILCIQYLAQAAQMLNQWDKSISIALQGIHLNPLRPEFHVLVGDAMLKTNRFADAIPFYVTARECSFAAQTGSTPLFSNPMASESYPTLQLARIWAQIGDFNRAKIYAEECAAKWPSAECAEILRQVNEVVGVGEKAKDTALKREKTDDIVITCPPVGAYPWDEEIYQQKGIGGSETAAVEMSRWLAKLTGRRVLIFNNTQVVRKFPSGVEYRPANFAPEYFARYLPAVNIQWRHTVRMTPAPSMIWCHDLTTPGLEAQDYDKAICLSPFASRYVQTIQGVPEEKIHVSRNGINSDRFRGWKVIKNPNKVVFPSSPDRGLDRAMRIMDKARQMPGCEELELHVYYGLDNLEKFNQGEMAKNLKAMMAERPWVKYHGNVKQELLAKELFEAAVWLYPANFIETFCITAIECLAAGCFPLVREMGALQNTLREAHVAGMARLLNLDAETELEQEEWAANLAEVIREKSWENVKIDLDRYSWESVAREWCEWLNLSIRS